MKEIDELIGVQGGANAIVGTRFFYVLSILLHIVVAAYLYMRFFMT